MCVNKLTGIALNNSTNKAVTLPIIGSLLTLRDKNMTATMNSFGVLDRQRLEVIRKLSRLYAPDLDENIQEYITPVMKQGNFHDEELENKKKKFLTSS